MPTAYLLLFFGLLIASAVVFGVIAQRSFAEAERNAAEQERLAAPQRRRETARRRRAEQRDRLWQALRVGERPTSAGTDQHPDLQEAMRALNRLDGMLEQAFEWECRVDGGGVLELCERAEQLYDVALGQAERAFNLSDLSSALPDSRAQSLRERREQQLEELWRSIETLATALDQLHATAVAGGFDGEAVARLRQDLDARLRVAAEVERQMNDLQVETEINRLRR